MDRNKTFCVVDADKKAAIESKHNQSSILSISKHVLKTDEMCNLQKPHTREWVRPGRRSFLECSLLLCDYNLCTDLVLV